MQSTHLHGNLSGHLCSILKADFVYIYSFALKYSSLHFAINNFSLFGNFPKPDSAFYILQLEGCIAFPNEKNISIHSLETTSKPLTMHVKFKALQTI